MGLSSEKAGCSLRMPLVERGLTPDRALKVFESRRLKFFQAVPALSHARFVVEGLCEVRHCDR